MNTWRKLISLEMSNHGEQLGDAVGTTLSGADLDAEFCDGYGIEEGKPFTLWKERRVYFPVCYDGSEWVGSAPRNPSEEATSHQGG